VTRKWKRGSGFKFSTKKVIERSRLSKEIARGRVQELGSVRMALTYPSALLNEIGVVDLGDCSTGSFGPASLHSVDDDEDERIDVGVGIADSVAECCKKVSILI
jgi:hypothetical protein